MTIREYMKMFVKEAAKNYEKMDRHEVCFGSHAIQAYNDAKNISEWACIDPSAREIAVDACLRPMVQYFLPGYFKKSGKRIEYANPHTALEYVGLDTEIVEVEDV